MADDIYDRPKGPFAKIRTVLVGILVGMLVLAFAVWGIEDVFSPNSSNAVVKVGEAEVGQAEFMDSFNDEMRRYADENGEGLTPQQAYDRGVPQQLIGQFTQQLAIEADATDLGIGVNNRDIVRYAQSIDVFRNQITQEFDRQNLRRILASNSMTEADFEKDVINSLTQQQTLPAIMGGILAPSEYAQRYNTFVNEIRRARLIRFDASALDTLPEPTEAELKSYIAANQARFTAPEYRRFLMIRIEPFDFRQDVEVTDEQLRERFDTLIGAGELGAVETRDVSVISVPTQDQANSVAARLTAGEDMTVLLAELGLQSADDFNGIKEDALINPDSSTAAFEASEGTAQVAATGFGSFEVVFVRTVNAADVPDFESMREQLTTDVIEGQALRTINDFERVIDDRLLEGATIEEIAQDLNVPLSSYPFIDRSGAMQDGTRLTGFTLTPGIATDDVLLQSVFTVDIGFESDIIATSNGGLAILRVNDTVDSTPKSFDTVSAEATRLWKAEQVTTALTRKGVALAKRVREGESLDTVAAELGLPIEQVALQRASPPNNVSTAVLVSLLDGDVGDVARGASRTVGGYEIAVLDTISNAGERLGGQMLDIIRGQVSEQIALDISRAYQDAILSEKPQMIFDDQIRAVLNLDPAN